MNIGVGIGFHLYSSNSFGEVLVEEIGEVVLKLQVGAAFELYAGHHRMVKGWHTFAEPNIETVGAFFVFESLFLIIDRKLDFIAGIEK